MLGLMDLVLKLLCWLAHDHNHVIYPTDIILVQRSTHSEKKYDIGILWDHIYMTNRIYITSMAKICYFSIHFHFFISRLWFILGIINLTAICKRGTLHQKK